MMTSASLVFSQLPRIERASKRLFRALETLYLIPLQSCLKRSYLYLSPFFVRKKAPSIFAERNYVGLHPLVCINATLCRHGFYSGNSLQINLDPLPLVSIASYPSASYGTMVPRLKSCAIRSIKFIVHGRRTKSLPRNAAIFHSKGYETAVYQQEMHSYKLVR